ncbi:MAG: DUF5679 domain-containing protein [Candidatus Pacearchaeota archaeon]
MVQARCMKCKEPKEMKTPEIVQTARGGYMAKGKCPTCSTTMCAMMSKDKAEEAIKKGAKKSF